MNSFGSATLALMCALVMITCPATAQTLPDYLPTDGLVAWYPFNGNANDESGNGNDGVVNGATLTEDRDGNPNAAFSFDGVDDYISVSSSPELSFTEGEFSFSLWCKVLSLDVDRAFIDRPQTGNRYNLRCREDGSVRVTARNAAGEQNYADSSESLLVGEVYHVVGVHSFSQASISIFLNGEAVPNELLVLDITDPTISPDIDLFLGKYGTSASYFHGTIDDIAIYNRALSADEVQSIYTGDTATTGCTYADACNYDADAIDDDGSCTFPLQNYDCEGNCLNDNNSNGICDDQELYGCSYADAINYDEQATADDGSCLYTCKGDFNGDAMITVEDLIAFLASYGNACGDAGCVDEFACNYDIEALYADDSCTYPEEFFNCDGGPVNDVDGDGVPDELEVAVAGCTDPIADNYNTSASDDDGTCSYISDLQVGDAFEGGLVAYIYQDGDPGFVEGEVHGFVVTDMNLATNSPWGCQGIYFGTSESLGSGMANTIEIVNGCEEDNIAAKLCFDYVNEGFEDWWLPSRSELQIIYNNRAVLNIPSQSHYWSSSDCSEDRARILNFVNAGWFNCSTQQTPLKNAPGNVGGRRVRAIRYF